MARLTGTVVRRTVAGMVALVASVAAAAPDTSLSDEQRLGKALFTDQNLSLLRNRACEGCHTIVPESQARVGLSSSRAGIIKQPVPGFADPLSALTTLPVSPSSTFMKFGRLNTSSAGYTAFTPQFSFDMATATARGGQFWDGRENTLEAQAAGPILDEREMELPSKWAAIERIKEYTRHQREHGVHYRDAFETVYDISLSSIESAEQTGAVDEAYHAITRAMSAFERSRMFNRFDSKFDHVAAGQTSFTPAEQRGYDLFTGKANCAACHSVAERGPDDPRVLFTDYSYHNLGLPKSAVIPKPEYEGLAGNPMLQARLVGMPDLLAAQRGKRKVVSLRNVSVTPPYMHNGVFTSLQDVVHFKNTRDTLRRCWFPDSILNWNAGRTCWPSAKVEANQTEMIGNLGLSLREEQDIVAFLETLTDGYETDAPSPYAHLPIPQSHSSED